MKAEIINGKSTSAKRSILANEIPLATPYIVQIFPVYGCNFRCNYCIHSIDLSKRAYISNEKFMDFDMYKKCIEDISEFTQKVKMLRFGATGEPLLHPEISEMIEYASKKEVANSIEIITNASLLTPKLTDKLVNSGLNWLRVSIQGLSSKKYKDISGVDINFEKLVENLKYFYDAKKDTKIYIKIIDVALEKGETERFFEIFGDICDKIAIEHLVPTVQDIDYTQMSDSKFDLTQNGNKVNDNIEICPQPFFMMQINPEGNVVPCCSMETSYITGNCTQNNLVDIWTGERYKEFQLQQLNKEKFKNKICQKCRSYRFALFEEDILDKHAEELKKLY